MTGGPVEAAFAVYTDFEVSAVGKGGRCFRIEMIIIIIIVII
jgi:hypothetical protein